MHRESKTETTILKYIDIKELILTIKRFENTSYLKALNILKLINADPALPLLNLNILVKATINKLI